MLFGSTSSRAASLMVALAASCHAPLLAQEPRQEAPQAAAAAPRQATPEEVKSSAQGDAYKPLGPALFPFYQHYLRTSDNTTVRNLLYLYSASENPNGSWSRLLLPFFYREHGVSPPKDLFFLFPLLYFHKSSEAESFNYAIPFFFDRSTPESSFQFLVPFWLHAEAEKVSRHHILFPLYRHTTDLADAAHPVRSSRLGLWKVLELFESRQEPPAQDYTALSFFNWSQETQGGLAVYRYAWAGEGGELRGKTHLFPFYWHGNTLGSKYWWLIPFYGYSQGPGQTDYFLFPLLSRIGGGSSGERRLDLLFPLFHYSEEPKSLSLFSIFFHYSKDEAGTSWSILHWPYRTTYTHSTGKRTHSLFFPWSYFDVEPDGSKGSRWGFPYIETFDDKRLWRFVLPLYYEYQALAGAKTDWFFRLGLPFFFSVGHPEDYFSMGFPLYWATRDGPRGWQLLLPIFFRSYSASAQSIHLFPLFSYRSFPSKSQLLLGGPLYVHETFYDKQRTPTGTGNHLLWPFFGVESRSDGYLFRLLPFFMASRTGDTRELLATPFYYQEDSPQGTRRYFVPFYGRYESDKLTRDFYALLSYIHTLEKDSEGATVRERRDYLWGLASSEEYPRIKGSHSHFVPLAYWSTKTPPEDRSILGPLYYSHRIVDGDEVHRLMLVLGNVFFSKTVEGPLPNQHLEEAAGGGKRENGSEAKKEAGSKAAAGENRPQEPTADEPGTKAQPGALYPFATRHESPPPAIGETWRDQGVLWPLSRWYHASSRQEGQWLFPFFFHIKGELKRNIAFFPFYFGQEDESLYQMSYFRYFFLLDREVWRGGHRWSFGQLVLDWKADENTESYRFRFLYPFLSYSWNREGYSFQLTPFFQLTATESSVRNLLFPIFWQGGTYRKSAAGEWRPETSHFFLFPLFGIDARATRTDYFAFFPLVHVRDATNSLHFEIWPTFFYRHEPTLIAVRLWPFHAHETGVTAGEFWVSRYLFFSKRFQSGERKSYRLDPFIFRISSGPSEFGIGGLFELFAYDRKEKESSFRMIPLVFGRQQDETASIGIIPFYYRRDFGKEEIDYLVPWRFFFLTNHLRGASGERHTGVLWKLFEYTDNPKRPEYHEAALLHRVFFDRRTETSRQWEINPIYDYYRDEAADETQHSCLFSLYNYRKLKGKVTHTLFYFITF